jgi:SAM-dependent methyltransferase
MAPSFRDHAAPPKERWRIQDLYLRPLAATFRRKRFRLIRSLTSALPRPLTILDVGGTEFFWQQVGFTEDADVKIVLLNLSKVAVEHPNFVSVAGDATSMREYGDKAFDLVFSNSVIEHVGGYDQQRRMADEVRRVGKRFCVQTPNRHFPIEPHFLIPFFQFYPMWLKVFLSRTIDIGSYGKISDRREAEAYFRTLRLLTEAEVRALFPEARIYKEKIGGMTKSFTAYYGAEFV